MLVRILGHFLPCNQTSTVEGLDLSFLLAGDVLGFLMAENSNSRMQLELHTLEDFRTVAVARLDETDLVLPGHLRLLHP